MNVRGRVQNPLQSTNQFGNDYVATGSSSVSVLRESAHHSNRCPSPNHCIRRKAVALNHIL
jgi:hypothetical protein